MRQDLKKSVSVLPEGEEKIISFGYDFSIHSISRILLALTYLGISILTLLKGKLGISGFKSLSIL